MSQLKNKQGQAWVQVTVTVLWLSCCYPTSVVSGTVLDQVNSEGYHMPGAMPDVHFGHSCSV